MKVLHILYRLMPSGAEKMLFDVAPLLRERGCESYILANDDEEGSYAHALRSRDCTVVRFPWFRNRYHLLWFWRFCRQEHIDVVHIHVIRGYVGFAIAARLAGVKTVIKSFHGIFMAKDPLRYLWHTWQRWTAHVLGVKMVAISKSVLQNERKTFHNPCELIWNFADDLKFVGASNEDGLRIRQKIGLPESGFVLLSVGNCHSSTHSHIKNHQLIFQALSLLPKDIMDNVYYMHVGSEMDGHPERCMAESLGISSHVMFMGSRDDIPELLSAANLYVMSSLQEGLGISTIEAAFVGRRMLLTKVKGLVDFGSVLRSGVDYCDLTPESMAAKIREAYERRSGLECDKCMRADALKVFSLESGCARLLALYGNKESPSD